MSEFSDRLVREKDRLGFKTHKAFAEHLGGFDPGLVRRWLLGEAIPRPWREIGRKLGIPHHEMAELIRAASADLQRQPSITGTIIEGDFRQVTSPLRLPSNVSGSPVPYRRGVKPMPIYGYAAGSPDGRLIMDGGAIDWVARPLELDDVEEAYGVLVDGDSMRERYRHGTRLNVNPNLTEHRPGHGVVVQIRDRQNGNWLSYVKEFVSMTREELVVRQYNPPHDLRFDMADVMSVHRVVGTVEV